MFAAGESPGRWARRRVARHVARCPACLEQVLLLRRLAGATEPLFHRSGAGVWPAVWRPAATAAAALVLAGLLYLGGVGGLRGPDQAEVPAVPVTPAQPESQAAPATAVKDKEELMVRPEPPRRKADRIREPAESPSADAPPAAAPAAPESGYAPEISLGVAPTPPAADAARERKDIDETRLTMETADRGDAEYGRAEIARNAPAAKAARAPRAESGAAPGAARLELNEAEQSKGLAAGDPTNRLAELCRTRRPDAPRIAWQGRRFFLVDGVLVEEGVCARLGRWPVRRATPAEVARLRDAVGYDPDWRGVWLLGAEEIKGW